MKITLFKKLAVLFAICYLLPNVLCGCDAFVRKFTRKPKKENQPQEEMVLVPIEYPPEASTGEAAYRKYLLFWKSWQDELIEALLANSSQKRKIDTAEQAIINLASLRNLLKESSRPKLDAYISRLTDIKTSIQDDPYGSNVSNLRYSAERLRRDILRDFSYNKVKDNLI